MHSTHLVKIEKMSIGGAGIARLDFEGQKLVVFIKKTAPEDLIKVRITKTEKTYLIGEVVEIIEKSQYRRDPPCPVAADCGGCSWQHILESQQVTQKELLLKELMQKFLPTLSYSLLPTINTSHSFEYRNRIQLKHLENNLGYYKNESHEIVSIEDCLIAEPPLREKIKELRKTLKPTKQLQKYEIRLTQNNEVEFSKIGLHGEDLSFSQVNRFINDLLVQKVLEIIQLKSPGHITELYAGSGNFTFPISSQLPNCTIDAVELNPQLTSAAINQIKEKKLVKRINYFTTKSETFCLNYPLSSDFVLLDPPRSGCHEDVIVSLQKTLPKNILYISCHPTMLVRDIALLNKSSNQYQIHHLQIFDMFPQTDHFETVCLLSRTEG